MAVPLDDAHPAGSTIGIALARHRADAPNPIGTLVFLPGGPGDSGVAALPNDVAAVPAGVRDRFDLVGFDPRGIGESDAVRCSSGTGSAPPDQLPDPVPTTPAARAALLTADREYAQGCAQQNGVLLRHVGTAAAVRDLERLRLALGVSRLSFVGQSYGTFLGLAYADAFPTHVRAMVLDGVVDPALPLASLSLEQAVSFDRQYAAFAQWCRSTGCAWSSADPTAALLTLVAAVARTRSRPAAGECSGRPRCTWAHSTSCTPARVGVGSRTRCHRARGGDGSPLRDLSDDYLVHGSSHFEDANSAYNCVDHPAARSVDAVAAAARVAARTAADLRPVLRVGFVDVRGLARAAHDATAHRRGSREPADPRGRLDRRSRNTVRMGARGRGELATVRVVDGAQQRARRRVRECVHAQRRQRVPDRSGRAAARHDLLNISR